MGAGRTNQQTYNASINMTSSGFVDSQQHFALMMQKAVMTGLYSWSQHYAYVEQEHQWRVWPAWYKHYMACNIIHEMPLASQQYPREDVSGANQLLGKREWHRVTDPGGSKLLAIQAS